MHSWECCHYVSVINVFGTAMSLLFFNQIFLVYGQYEDNRMCISCIHFVVQPSKVTFGWSKYLTRARPAINFGDVG